MLFPCLVVAHDVHPTSTQRIFVVSMLGVCIALMYGMRADLSVGVQEMQSTWDGPGWTGVCLSAFFIGYFFGNIPGSMLAQQYGARRVLAAGVAVASAANAFIPVVSTSPLLVVLVRIVCGLSQACTFPCAYQLLDTWATPATRSRAVTLSMSLGVCAGSAGGFVISEALRVQLGLAGCFGVWSVCGTAWTAMWLLLVPEYGDAATSSIGAPGFTKPAVPWRVLAFQPTLLVLYCCHVAANFVNYGLLTQLPLFLKSALHATPALLAVGTTLPYAASVVLAAIAAAVADAAISRGISRSLVRKAFTALGIGSSGVLLYAAGCATDAQHAVALIVAANGMLGAGQSGWQSLYLDAFGAFSGQAYSYSNTIATVAGIVAPVIASTMVERLGDVSGFRVTFAVFGPLCGLPAVGLFCRVASAERVLMRPAAVHEDEKQALSLLCAREDGVPSSESEDRL